MALGEAYGQTDVMHDPNYLQSMLASRDPRQRAQAEAGLRDLQAREIHHQQLMEFQQREADRQAAHEGNLGIRQTALEQARLAKEELNQRGEAAAADKKTALMAHLLANPQALAAMQGGVGTDPTSAAITKAVVNKMLSDAGVQVNLPVDAKQAALAKAHGLPVPQGETLGGGGGAQTAAATPQLGEGMAERFGTPTIQRNVDAGHVVGPLAQQIPKGMDLNFNTGELVAQNKEGTINGKPAGQAIAEGALRTGIMPESPSGNRELAKMTQQRGLAGGNPPPNESMTPPMSTPNWLQGDQLVSQPKAAQPTAQLGVPNPQPNPTPAPGSQTQFQGPFTATGIAQAPWNMPNAPQVPQPHPVLTPPAIPPNKKLTPQEQQMVFQQ